MNQPSMTALKDSLSESHWAPIVWQTLFRALGTGQRKKEWSLNSNEEDSSYRKGSLGQGAAVPEVGMRWGEQRQEQKACSREKSRVVRSSPRASEAVRPGTMQSAGTAPPPEPVFPTAMPMSSSSS